MSSQTDKLAEGLIIALLNYAIKAIRRLRSKRRKQLPDSEARS